MTRDELLTRLAMELAEWPDDISSATSLPNDWMWVYSGTSGRMRAVAENEEIGKSDWLAERERLINKPSWGDHHFKWVKQYSDGAWAGTHDDYSASWKDICQGCIPAGHDWGRTLEQRPDTLTTSLGASEWDEERIDIIGSNGNDGLAYSAEAWNGEGLPPVGACCEVYLTSGRWEPVKIEAYGREHALFTDMQSRERVEYLHALRHRPIRSDEDRAVEEMSRLFPAGMSEAMAETVARHIYRAGYRKMEAAQ